MSRVLGAVFFDVDDTLFDREQAQRQMALMICREFARVLAGIDSVAVVDAFLESDRIAIDEFYAGPAGASGDTARLGRSRHFLRLLGLSEEHAQRVTTLYQDAYPRIDAPVAGAKQVVRHLADRFRLGVISNSMPDVQYQKLETLGLREFFDVIVLSEEVGIRKPDPRIFQTAAALCQREPRECLHVGDSFESDVIGAKGAGMKTCWFNPLRKPVPEGASLPEYEISTLQELLVIVEQGSSE